MTQPDPQIYPPSPESSSKAHVKSLGDYHAIHQESVVDPESFWSKQAAQLDWNKPFSKVLDWDFDRGHVRWFEDGTLNVSVNCIDRHVEAGRGDECAIIWEGDEPDDDEHITFSDLLRRVSRFANVLRKHGVKKGDRVCIYLPMVPELAIAMLACSRIGAVHSIVFGGFSAESLKNRILDSTCSILIAADGGKRGGRELPLGKIATDAVEGVDCVVKKIWVQCTQTPWAADPERDLLWSEEVAAADISDECVPEEMNAEDPLFILYTSGSTGKPKGLVHTTGGYLTYAAYTHKMVFDWHPEDVYWCTADIGWITGHTYIVYGPLANGATTIMFAGVPNYPDIGRFWDVCDKHKVNIFYTAPTAIRAIMRHGDEPVQSRDRSSLRILGTVGEPINPDVWRWYYDVVGEGKCRVVDTYWQTETGGIIISPLPGATPAKPGSATLPMPGVRPALMDESGQVVEGNDVSGNLCMTFPWPGMARTIYGDHERFFQTYFTAYPGNYFTGDGCRRDKDGYYWITGRVDDVINVSGHRLGTAEVESALITHDLVTEAAVVGMPHEIKGQGIYAFVTLIADATPSDSLMAELVQTVRTVIGPVASPDCIQFAPGLPKTRSGKIMRRILRKIVEGEEDRLGDISTLADPQVVSALIKGRVN
ncbi:MAG: acetyl-CoA synthetase [Planctomycetota bacterium]|jgi:acetyl-CoA synthetase